MPLVIYSFPVNKENSAGYEPAKLISEYLVESASLALGRGNIQVTKEGGIYQLHEMACGNRNQAAENALERIAGKINQNY